MKGGETSATTLQSIQSVEFVQGTGTGTGTGCLQYAVDTSVDCSGLIANSTSVIVIDTNGNTVTFSTPLSDTNTGGLTIMDSTDTSGSLTLKGPQNFSGNITINSGTLALSNYANTVNTAIIYLQGGFLQIQDATTPDVSPPFRPEKLFRTTRCA